eukprot:TRINITY_DN10891_c0_g1_i1.p1 TRINITY_DN10891_c0_g1~~TRINITY_DN10891_c0_g1_i1.p1  ORF type:complete len:116 (+),score=2.52 TRINITY_DN10891_c0_g1_i1:67-414(+)
MPHDKFSMLGINTESRQASGLRATDHGSTVTLSRALTTVSKRQTLSQPLELSRRVGHSRSHCQYAPKHPVSCLLYTSDAADEEDSVDLGGRRITKKKKKEEIQESENTKKMMKQK